MTRITFQISEEEKAALELLAAKSGLKLSAYIRAVLTDAIEHGAHLEQRLARLTRPVAPSVILDYGTPDNPVQHAAETAAEMRAAQKKTPHPAGATPPRSAPVARR